MFYIPTPEWRRVVTGATQYTLKVTGAVRVHVGDTPTDSDGVMLSYSSQNPFLTMNTSGDLWVKAANSRVGNYGSLQSVLWYLGDGTAEESAELAKNVLLYPGVGVIAGGFSTYEPHVSPTSFDLPEFTNSSGTVEVSGTSLLLGTNSWARFPASTSGVVWTTVEKSGTLEGTQKITGHSGTVYPDGNLLARDKFSDPWVFTDLSASSAIRVLTGTTSDTAQTQIDAVKYTEMDEILEAPVDIIVGMGQSLGLGMDPVMDASIDGWTDARMSAVHLTSDQTVVAGQEYPLTAPLNHQNNGRDGVCPLVHWGKTIEGFTEEGRRTLFVAGNWAGSSLVSEEGEWNIANDGVAWVGLTGVLDTLLETLPTGSRVKCINWDHGQSEYSNLSTGVYQAAVVDLISTFRARYGDCTVFISGNIPSATATLAQELIYAQASFDTDSGSDYAVEDCIFVPREDIMQTIDGTHPDAASQRLHGQNLGATWRNRFNV